MKSAKILLLAVATLCALAAFCACGGQNDNAPEHIHEFGEWEITKSPTCFENGTEERYCDCGQVQSKNIPALSHNYVDGECTNCGDIKEMDNPPATYSEGLEFTLNEENQSYAVTGIGTCTDTDIFIPNTYEGLPVTSIDSYVFSGCTGLKSVVIGDSVTSIGYRAFDGCVGLTSIVIPGSVTSIGWYAFEGCNGLKEIHISDVDAWCNISFSRYDSNPMYYGANLYLDGNLVTELIIPDSVTSISSYTFYGCTGLKSVVIGDRVKDISYEAFCGCTSLESIVIPDSVTSIGNNAFSGCTGLKSVVIGDSVTSIDSYVFSGCTGLKSVVIGDSVTSIGYRAFEGCVGLTSIVIPGSVTSIGSYAFSSCTGLTDVYYTGTEAEWAKISIDYNNECLTYATIHYNYVPAN